jgi:hypothetical protein
MLNIKTTSFILTIVVNLVSLLYIVRVVGGCLTYLGSFLESEQICPEPSYRKNCGMTINRYQEWYHWNKHTSISVVVGCHV